MGSSLEHAHCLHPQELDSGLVTYFGDKGIADGLGVGIF